MSYEDSRCPCGGKKPPGTMLCDECVAHFADRRELRDYQNTELALDWRAHAATILIALARGRRANRLLRAHFNIEKPSTLPPAHFEPRRPSVTISPDGEILQDQPPNPKGNPCPTSNE